MRHIKIIFFILLASPVFAQTEFSLYRMNNNVPQANYLNPALYPNHKVIIGLPVISSLRFAVDTDGIAFRDVFKRTETDSLALDTTSLFKNLKATNRISFRDEIQLFFLGIRGKRSFYSFSVQQVGDFRMNYPGDLVGWAIRGPGHPAYSGQPLQFRNFYGRSMVYNKVSLSYAREVTRWLRIGGRFNYILGVAAAETTDVSGSLTMSMDSIHISSGVLRAQTSGIDFFNQDDLTAKDYQSYLLNTKNRGMSIDLGAAYDVNDNITVTASLTDVGFINWKDYTRSYQIDPITYTFRGFDLLDYVNKGAGDEFVQHQLDSLEGLYKSTETKGGTFKTPLIAKFYAGVNLRVLRVNHFSALVYFDMFRKKIDPALSLGYNLQLGRTLNATMGVTYQNGRINNVGAGLMLKLTHLQFYASSDRANSMYYPARASRADVRMGMNLVFGKAQIHNPPKKRDEQESSAEEPIQDEKQKEETIQEQLPAADTTTAASEPVQPVEKVPAEIIEQQPTLQKNEPTQDSTYNAPAPKVETEQIAERHDVIATPTTVSETSTPVIRQPEPAIVKTASPSSVQQSQPVAPEPRYEVVQKGTNRDELEAAHYVIVGSFKVKANAERYIRTLKAAGHAAQTGYASEKGVYYVYVSKTSDIGEARSRRDNLRSRNDFEFSAAWILTVVE